MKKFLLSLTLFLCGAIGIGPSEGSNYSYAYVDETKILQQAPNLNPRVLELALKAYAKVAQQDPRSRPILTIVDYEKPSYENRFFVIDLTTNQVLFNTLVSHGQGSGMTVATHFSNKANTKASSLGVYETGSTYYGQHGYSLRVHGLEPGINDAAFRRTIVIHQAPYVSPEFAKQYKRVGRSYGCFALDQKIYKKVINTVSNRTVLFAYYPDHDWLSHSNYLA